MTDYDKTRSNIFLFYQDFEMPGGYDFDHQETIKTIDLYYNGHFRSGEKDSDGNRKYFFNVVKPSCDVAEKFIDLDTKDINMISERAGDEYRIWVMMRDLKMWLKHEGFAHLLNEIAHDFPKYGHVVIKRLKGNKLAKVNIQNLRMDPTSPTLEDSPFVYEIHDMGRREILDMGWNMEEVEKMMEDYKEEPRFRIYECYELNMDIKGKKWKRKIKAEFLNVTEKDTTRRVAEADINMDHDYEPGYCLWEDEVDELPYRELKWEDVPGRWLGFGFAEYLFDNQRRQNEIANVKAKGLLLASMQIFQTDDESIGNNLFTDVKNGDIVYTRGGGIRPIGLDARNLGAFQEEQARWDLNTDQKTFSFDVARGGTLPSQTPLGVAQLTAGQVISFFELKREKLGLFVKDLLLDDVIPAFQKEKKKEHILKFFGSDKEIGKLRKAFTDFVMRKKVFDMAEKTGIIPSAMWLELERQRVAMEIKKRKDLELIIPEGFYQDVKFTIDIIVTGESVDVGTRSQTIVTAMQLVGSNPAMLTDPRMRTMFFKLLELAGLNALDLDLIEQELEDAEQEMPGLPAPPGAGAPQGAPAPSNAPMPVQQAV